MTHMKTWGWVLLCLLLICLPVFAQETAVKGNISGVVQDSTGAVVPAAKVTVTGPQGEKTVTTEADGRFLFSLLQPAAYSIKVEKQGFRAADVKGVVVEIGKTTSVSLKLEPGAVGEVIEVTGNATTVDTTSTAVGANLSDTFYQQVPVARNVASLFYVAPGATDSGASGHANPSISGASGLENLYVADGVNITDSAYGGLGTFTRNQGSVGSGINLSFIKEVQVKTGGFEPQYGEATGGIVQLVTKSGSNQWHGEIGVFAAPGGAQGAFLQTDAIRTNHNGFYNGNANYDADGQLGGYVPGFKNHLFFFGDFNPSWQQQYVQSPPTAGLAALGQLTLFSRTLNYAGKMTFRINDNHQVEASVFGDPTKTNATAQDWVLNTPNDTGFSKWDYGTRNFVARYNGTLSPTWLVNGSFTWEHGHFTEIPKFDVLQVVDNTNPSAIHTLQGFGNLENNTVDSYAFNVDTQKIIHAAGEHTISVGYRHERPKYDDIFTASGGTFPVPDVNATGGDYLNCTAGSQACPKGANMFLWGGSLNPEPGCTLCPNYNGIGPVAVQFGRGRFDSGVTPTYGRYHAGYVNDAWQMSKYVTLSMGIRWEQWKMAGTGSNYTFTDNWVPRVGVSIDPMGDRKTKLYGNFGRYNYKTPLDAAIRSLSGEKDLTKMVFAPDADASGNVIVNSNGSINITPDAAHTLNAAAGGVGVNPGIGASLTGGEGFAPGTKMMYQDEFLVGVEHEFKGGLVLSGRFIYRDMPRIVEDMAGVSPEAFNFNPNQTQLYFIGNPSPRTDLFPNEHEVSITPQQYGVGGAGPMPTGCTTADVTAGNAFVRAPFDPSAKPGTTGIQDANGGLNNPSTGQLWNNGNGVCWQKVNGFWGGEQTATGSPIPDGQPDGFPTPIHIYKAVEIEANKSFSHNWMLRANWRIASLQGNYEGAFRNDNRQTDPNISSLFDFTNGIVGMLGDQYKKGPLNTDRRHIVNIYTSYVLPSGFLKALELGGGVNISSGNPVSNFADHPAYGNAGEVPIGIRGILGRTPVSGGVNLHVEKPFKITEKGQFRVSADLFNVTNSRPVVLYDQNNGISFSPAPNPDFQKVQRWTYFLPGNGPTGYQKPFYARFSARFVF